MSKETDRMVRLIESYNERGVVIKEEKCKCDNPDSTNKLNEEFARLKQLANRVDEKFGGGSQGSSGAKIGAVPTPYVSTFSHTAPNRASRGYGHTVNTFLPGLTSQGNASYQFLQPEEAIFIAIKRAVDSGAPVNNMGLYDEVNWNLNNMGFPSQNPIDIKGAMQKTYLNKAE